MASQAQAVPANVRAEMARQRVPQSAVAKVLGKTQQAVSSRLSGKVDFSISELTQVAELLNIDVTELLDDTTSSARSAS